ncbi:MAG: FAD-dependent monooxygenase [Pseudomonadota bacterium]
MDDKTDLIIVGGGVVGLATAVAAASTGLSARVLDAGPAAARAMPDFDGRAYALAVSARRMLTALELWPELEPHAAPILDIQVSDGRAGEGAAPWTLHFDHREAAEGPMGHIVEDRYLRRAVQAAAAASERVAVEPDAPVVRHDAGPGAVTVTLADGTSRAGSVLIAADGRSSPTAARVGIGRVGWGYHQTSLVVSVAPERGHAGVAHQMFFPEGPLAILPLPEDRVSIVWTEAAARAADIMSLDDAGYARILRPRFGSYLGRFELVGRRYAYPLGLSLAARLTDTRLALVGDAAHGIHPLAGQGLNLGLRDVAALVEVLGQARRRGEDPGEAGVLDRYARWRRFDIAALAVGTDVINRVFSNADPLLRLGRVGALGAIAGMPALRRGLMRQAMGLSGDLPALLQGRTV